MAFLASLAQRAFILVHGFLYRLTGGVIGGRLFGSPILLLTTTGRRTGKQRTTPLLYMRQGEDWVVVASNGGAPRHPAWWHNLQSHPEATIQVMRQTIRVTARPIPSEEKEILWPALVRMYPTYEEYQRKAKRDIPLVLLQRWDA